MFHRVQVNESATDQIDGYGPKDDVKLCASEQPELAVIAETQQLNRHDQQQTQSGLKYDVGSQRSIQQLLWMTGIQGRGCLKEARRLQQVNASSL
jgi:hypothetical protein